MWDRIIQATMQVHEILVQLDLSVTTTLKNMKKMVCKKFVLSILEWPLKTGFTELSALQTMKT